MLTRMNFYFHNKNTELLENNLRINLIRIDLNDCSWEDGGKGRGLASGAYGVARKTWRTWRVR